MEAAGFSKFHQILSAQGHVFGKQQQQNSTTHIKLESLAGHHDGTHITCPRYAHPNKYGSDVSKLITTVFTVLLFLRNQVWQQQQK